MCYIKIRELPCQRINNPTISLSDHLTVIHNHAATTTHRIGLTQICILQSIMTSHTPVHLYCIFFVFMLVLLCFCVATEFSVNKDLYIFVECFAFSESLQNN